MNLKPLPGIVVVEQEKVKTQVETPSGIVVPTDRVFIPEGKIVDIGLLDVPVDIKVGDTVRFKMNHVEAVDWEDKKYLLVPVKSLIAVIKGGENS